MTAKLDGDDDVAGVDYKEDLPAETFAEAIREMCHGHENTEDHREPHRDDVKDDG